MRPVQIWILAACATLASCNTNVPEPKKQATEQTIPAPTEIEPFNDVNRHKDFLAKAENIYQNSEFTSSDTYKKAMFSEAVDVNVKAANTTDLPPSQVYDLSKNGVLIIGHIYKSNSNPDLRIRTESAFMLSEEGICVTNYHVFKSFDPSQPLDYYTSFVMDFEGNISPVEKILSASKQDDLCLFKVNPAPLKSIPLALGADGRTASDVSVISHPDYRYFRFSSGYISRTYIKAGTNKLRQSISASFGKGSSGAPVFDKSGNVIGIASSTENIYYNPNEKGYQMTIREIIPVSRLKALLQSNK